MSSKIKDLVVYDLLEVAKNSLDAYMKPGAKGGLRGVSDVLAAALITAGKQLLTQPERTAVDGRTTAWTPERRAKHAEAMHKHWTQVQADNQWAFYFYQWADKEPVLYTDINEVAKITKKTAQSIRVMIGRSKHLRGFTFKYKGNPAAIIEDPEMLPQLLSAKANITLRDDDIVLLKKEFKTNNQKYWEKVKIDKLAPAAAHDRVVVKKDLLQPGVLRTTNDDAMPHDERLAAREAIAAKLRAKHKS